jgi:hypothetical protein
MVRDGVDAISGSFEFRGGFIQSPTRAVVSDSTPLRSRALRLLRLPARAARGRRSAFSVTPGAPSGRGRARPATKLITTYTRAGLRGYVITYRQSLHVLHTYHTSWDTHTGGGTATGPSAIATSGPLRSVSGCARYGYPRPYRSRSASRAVGACSGEREAGLLDVLGSSVPLYTTTGA